ncbi:unnamed protein product [Cylicocyclus nassatus]|uniref:DUF5641 domain-containing protein n=1 Tax=Cylicocyclus nassatus TaxID=53992 RepID=A0AA36M640_CYLNA|nr:unnamed protein product [Cylicocyclus nassatus]
MAMRLGTSKRLLTRYTKKLETIITHLKNEGLETLTAASQEGEEIRDNLRQLNEGIGAITAFTEKIEKLLMDYATDVSGVQGLDEQELSSFEEYSAKAEEVLASAFDCLVLLKSRRQAYTVCTSREGEASNTTPEATEGTTPQVQPRLGSELPALPIPVFRGNIWEWDNFWELLNTNIHSQQIPDLYKFNYLKNALRGEAYQAIEKFQVKYPVDLSREEEEDPSYVSSEELVLLRTKKQTIEALQSSCKAVEKFWQVWQTHYLTSLREKHQKDVGQKRGCSYEPHNGDLVMIADPVQPRQAWKLGRIIELVENHSGVVREAGVMLPSRHKIRRPVNLLVPLELEQYPANSRREEDAGNDKPAISTEETVTHPYNLRPNRKKNYIGSILHSSVLLTTILGLIFSNKGVKGQQLPNQSSKISRTMKCIPVSCGEVVTTFEVGGILKYTVSFEAMLYKLSVAELDGETTFLKTILGVASPQAELLEPQLQAILKSLHNQRKTGSTIGKCKLISSREGEDSNGWRGKKQEYDGRAETVLKLVQSLMSFTQTSITQMEGHLSKVEEQVSASEETNLAVQCKQLKERIQEIELGWAHQVERLEKESQALKEKIQEQNEDKRMDWSAEVEEAVAGNKEQEKEKCAKQNDETMDWTAPEEVTTIDQANDNKTSDSYEDDRSETNEMETTFFTIERLMDQEDSSKGRRDSYHAENEETENDVSNDQCISYSN